ncbi:MULTISPECIES: 30S ribosomal protein S4 [Azospira]|jgi:small subunit ribosomal protein S4|uniref:Small ribosomal subunit protein uS4 n=2 Tax=Azospira oryzae TaxID=146939 RepID=G8QFJ8_AZOOP|nr:MULTISPECIES: 30S ribosomal protein S4 [Azospira]TLS16959.1 MAG: 30S ribosomal protein S4 [Betaproteobacteria bacterium]AEV26064.1 ribosomal protein S4, bacterial/organelle type [Azospira oryzae PS]MBP7490009.1 30S ribosomal protein S4 [Azospira sp.]MDK9690459.1 30S ribosomal protein S4 [Azospira sp.]RZT75671.1 SSU ribosomal protein S4P [Azospira oryzae]
MSRHTGPRLKIMRALGTELPGLSRKTRGEREQPPGQHGARKVAGRKSEFGLQLMEKQKLRFNYGVSETQLRRIVKDARRDQGATGHKIVELLERRLDNLVFRAGLAPTIPAARQLVSHGHIALNGRRATIPSIRVKAGDAFGPVEKSRNLLAIKASLAEPALERPEWIAFEEASLTARLSHLPDGDAAPFPLDLQRVVEYYATRL